MFTFQENPKPNSVRYLVGYSQVFEDFVGIFSTIKDSSSRTEWWKGVRMREAEEEASEGDEDELASLELSNLARSKLELRIKNRQSNYKL